MSFCGSDRCAQPLPLVLLQVPKTNLIERKGEKMRKGNETQTKQHAYIRGENSTICCENEEEKGEPNIFWKRKGMKLKVKSSQ